MKHRLFLFAISFSALGFAPQPASAQPTKPKTPVFKAWNLPENALFFKERANDDWFEVPEEQREWLMPARLTLEAFKALDPKGVRQAMRRGPFEPITSLQQQKQVQEAALATWKQGVRAEWLPPLALIVAGELNPTPPRPVSEVGYSTFERGNVHGLYMAAPNREFWLYLEQPLAMKASSISVRDVLRPELFSAPIDARPAIRSGEFIRFRAPLPQGAYQQVRILLIHVELPQSLEFANFAYPGQLKP